MTENPIVEEIHRIRKEILAEFNGDLDALMKDAQRRTEILREKNASGCHQLQNRRAQAKPAETRMTGARMMIDKYHLNLAGEYRTCAELLKRGVFATVTFGNMKSTDVVAVGPNRRAAIVEVKASNSTRVVTRFYQTYKTLEMPHPDFWVLYSVTSVEDKFSEHFYVLTHDEMARYQAIRNGVEELTYSERAARCEKGVDNLDVSDLGDHEDKWDRVVRFCSDAL
jgi:hypothetical protein